MSGKNKNGWSRFAYTIAAVGLILLVIFVMMMYVYKHSEQEAFETLHRDTLKIKNDINLQMLSDRENLQTMAGFASKLYSHGEDFELVIRGFNEIGLIKNVGILMPDNRIITKAGTFDGNGSISFEEEKNRGTYVSGRVQDVTNPDREVVRSVVPIEVDGDVVAILYGIIELDTLAQRYNEDVTALDAKLYIIEGDSGRFIVDTKNVRLGNITELAANKFKKSFTYDSMLEDITNGDSGYSAFYSRRTEEYVYVHYSDLDVADWRIMLSRPQNLVFEGARRTGGFLFVMLAAVVLIMLAYLVLSVSLSEKKAKVNMYASLIRKKLITYNSYNDGVYEALKIIRDFGVARSAFFVDTLGEFYHEIKPALADKLIVGNDRTFFVQTLLNRIAKENDGFSTDVRTIRIVLDKETENEMPEFTRILRRNDIHSIHFAGVIDDRNNVSVIGVTNPKNAYIDMLFHDIAVCFAIAIYNKKHLVKTEAMALTDSLTNLENRMAYKENISRLKKKNYYHLGCIYIDVNELHYFNNQYGHAAGDQMLAYIADELKSEFAGNHIYRMGGDEFLVFTEGVEASALDMRMKKLCSNIEEMKYHISYGISIGDGKCNVEEMVSEAEKNMYADKSEYYHNKEYYNDTSTEKEDMKTVKTGNRDVDALLSVISTRYLGVYSVSLDSDKAQQLVAPEYYFDIENESNKFSDVVKKYIHGVAKPEFHRVLMSFIEYDSIREQLLKGHIPHITYIKADGDSVALTVYPNSGEDDEEMNTLWVFERIDN